MVEFAWYDVVPARTGLQQGDFLLGCVAPVQPIVIEAEETVGAGEATAVLQDEEAESPRYDRVVVLSQSCDIENGKTGRVLVSPADTLQSLLEAIPKGEQKTKKKHLTSYQLASHHLLNVCNLPDFQQGHLVVHFADAFSIPLSAVNAGAADLFRASFADDALVVDVNRELRGADAITAWAAADIFDAHVHFDVLDVSERQGRTIVRVKIDGTFDRTGLPDPLVMNHEFTVAKGKIAELRIGF